MCFTKHSSSWWCVPVLLAAAVMVACNPATEPDVGVPAVAAAVSNAQHAGGPHSATGSAVEYTLELALPPDEGGPPFPPGTTLPLLLSFSAVQHPNGTVSGNGVANQKGGPPVFHFSVDCVSFDGNQAWIGTRLTKSAFPFPELSGFWVEDNGEGTNADPDRISSFTFVRGIPGGEDWCDAQMFPFPPLEVWETGTGNIQVR